MNKTKIEWCDSTWNPVTGCLHGCEYCYARKQANRFKGCILDNAKASRFFKSTETKTTVLYDVATAMQRKTKKGDIVIAPYPFGFSTTLHRYKLGEPQKWKKPRTIFVCSMADLFGEWVPDEWIDAVFAACKKAPQHRYLFLTKNPKRYLELAKAGKLPKSDNMWYGSTATTPDTEFFFADKFNTFLSIEPLMMNFGAKADTLNVDWLIIGAETGNRKGKIVPEKAWIENICQAADKTGIPVFMKDSLLPTVGEEKMRCEFPW